ncbi:MFS transporter [Kribbella turkmenica]|uniref:MFS transporter n=1 Tax=Kribbella turkmenica TaxID=2530375 RepID=A0A4V2YF79_9ACTN|nr:MFS transporter [Kribbella turkmenica]TDD22177.1 MFS transporter [Kribbella turkmenica]
MRLSEWRPALILLCAADVLVTLDGTIVTVALPAIERDLGTAQADLQWVVTAYTLTLGAFLLVGGRAGDLFGRRRILVVGLVVFALASGVAGLAHTTALLLSARAVQGLGAALAVPAALALLTATYRRERQRQRALGYLSAAMDLGMVAGLVLGGVLTATVGWPWCFFIVVPVGLLAAALAPTTLQESRDDDAPRLDVLGAILVATGFGTLALGISRAEQLGVAVVPVIAAAVALLGGFVVLERRTPAPMLRPAIFRHRALTGSNLALIANAGGFGGMMFLATLYLQQVLGFSALETGLAFVPLALSACAGGLAAPRIVAAAGPRRAAALSMVTSAAAFVLLSRTPEVDGYLTHLLPAFTIAGFSFAAAFVPLTSHGMSGVRDGERGLASGLLQTSTHLGGAIVLTALATTATSAAAFTAGSSTAFLIGATLLTLGALTAIRTLPRTDG